MTAELLAHYVVGPLGCNCYVVGDPATRQAVVVDPGGDAERLVEELVRLDVTVTAIVATHAHFDHLIAGQELRAHTGAPFHLHDADRFLLDWWHESGRLFLGVELPPPPEVDAAAPEGLVLEAGSTKLEVLHTPGHSPGSISLAGAGALFSGDALFAGSVGRTDLPGGDTKLLVDAIKSKLFAFGDDTPVYPGHGEPTTVGQEKERNPFVGRDARWVP
ncbi:MAG TPA: MBL fold metallo-hydrolase [Actinomycetota bacterium]|nr:MBL fold metallo-hydrolase [Actinomycetota bacterium]